MWSTRKVRQKWEKLVIALFLPLSVAPGCQSMTTTDKGALTGAALGTAVGAAAGSSRGKTLPGAVIGGVVGTVAGVLAGGAIENSERKAEARAAAVEAARPVLSLQEIANLTSSGSSDDVIINQIRLSGAVYNLSGAELLWLQQSGVHEPVIREMQASAYRNPRPYYTAVPVAQPVYVVPAGSPPIGFGVTYIGGRRW